LFDEKKRAFNSGEFGGAMYKRGRERIVIVGQRVETVGPKGLLMFDWLKS